MVYNSDLSVEELSNNLSILDFASSKRASFLSGLGLHAVSAAGLHALPGQARFQIPPSLCEACAA